jgi:hypothetical protein
MDDYDWIAPTLGERSLSLSFPPEVAVTSGNYFALGSRPITAAVYVVAGASMMTVGLRFFASIKAKTATT